MFCISHTSYTSEVQIEAVVLCECEECEDPNGYRDEVCHLGAKSRICSGASTWTPT